MVRNRVARKEDDLSVGSEKNKQRDYLWFNLMFAVNCNRSTVN